MESGKQGQGQTSKTPRFEFATGLTQPHVDLGDANFQYRANAVMNVLNLYETSKSFTMSFYQSGVLRIEIDSGIGLYEYNFLHSTWASVGSWDELELEDACMGVDWDPEAPKRPGRPRSVYRESM